MLLIFPNTFEYFFIVYEALRLRWNPDWLSRRTLIGIAAVIWIFVKLPQEWWIHIAQLDTTDLVRAHPWLGVLARGGARRAGRRCSGGSCCRGCRRPTTRWRIEADPIPPAVADPARRDAWIALHRNVFDRRLVEKIVLVFLVCVIFAQIVPGVTSTSGEILIGAAILITIDSTARPLDGAPQPGDRVDGATPSRGWRSPTRGSWPSGSWSTAATTRSRSATRSSSSVC